MCTEKCYVIDNSIEIHLTPPLKSQAVAFWCLVSCPRPSHQRCKRSQDEDVRRKEPKQVTTWDILISKHLVKQIMDKCNVRNSCIICYFISTSSFLKNVPPTSVDINLGFIFNSTHSVAYCINKWCTDVIHIFSLI